MISSLLCLAALWPGSGLAFIENQGQWDGRARFAARRENQNVWLEEGALTLQTSAAGTDPDERRVGVVRLVFEGARPSSNIVGENLVETRFHYFLGADEERWRSDVRAFGSVLYEGLYPGIDLRVRDGRDRRHLVEYDWILAPGADLTAIVVRVEGGEGLSIDSDGSLMIETALGPIRQAVPVTWSERSTGERLSVDARYRVVDEGRFAFAVPVWDGEERLVIDPGVEWSTYLGGGAADSAYDVAMDDSGRVTSVGSTYSDDFPTTVGAFSESRSGSVYEDAYVSRFSPDGRTLLFSTYIGGALPDHAFAVCIDESGDVLVGGATSSDDFPTTVGPGSGSSYDGFVFRLSSDGSTLVYSRRVGGSAQDRVFGLAVDRLSGAVDLVGETRSPDFPTTSGAFDTTHNGGEDAYVVRVSPDGGVVSYATFLGGTEDDFAMDVCVDSGVVTLVGRTESSDLPTSPGAFQRTADDSGRAFVARLKPNGRGQEDLVYSSHFGPSFSFSAVDVDSEGVATMVGSTDSTDFPTTPGAFDTTYGPAITGADLVLVRMTLDDRGAEDLLYSTYFGGGLSDSARDLAVDASGIVTLVGRTTSLDLPVTPGAFQVEFGRGSDAFVARLRPFGEGPRDLLYASYLGGEGFENAVHLAMDDQGSVVISGNTTSSDNFPITDDAYDPTFDGPGDAYVTRVDMLPIGVAKYGEATGCSAAMDVGERPVAGSETFAILASGAPRETHGWLFVSHGQDRDGSDYRGVRMYVALDDLHMVISSVSSAVGYGEVRLPLSSVEPGERFFAQFVWISGETFSASNALEITVQ